MSDEGVNPGAQTPGGQQAEVLLTIRFDPDDYVRIRRVANALAERRDEPVGVVDVLCDAVSEFVLKFEARQEEGEAGDAA